ncbi:sigma-70 family RNA polymerase sigma factor [Clostridium bovifaecis]|uniref:Sigma-70 family RNA polymerase sigma factor n=1 Tax=Clostridium bovifaecis TaxID=2184719 RepID=A0A6I6EPR2_9CLOT|nr:sigma-70 family RNA polymerase sigma factor [Clostridium bovifaecis]
MNIEIENLVKEAKRGNNLAKTELVKRFRPFVIKKAKEVYIKNHDMEDLIQMGNVSILKAIDKYNLEKGNFISYVTYAINNNFNYEIRKRGKERFEGSLNKALEEGMEIFLKAASDNIDIEENIIGKERINYLKKALIELRPEEKELIISIYFNEVKIRDYADKMNIKYGTVLKRKRTALSKLKKKLESFYNV